MKEKKNDMNEKIYKLLYFYKDKEQPIHIALKSGDWVNGLILNVNDDFQDRVVILERRYGEC